MRIVMRNVSNSGLASTPTIRSCSTDDAFEVPAMITFWIDRETLKIKSLLLQYVLHSTAGLTWEDLKQKSGPSSNGSNDQIEWATVRILVGIVIRVLTHLTSP